MDSIQPLTTVDKVRNTAPDMTEDISDDTLNALIETASTEVLADGFPATVEAANGQEIPVQEMATRYLVLHLASMDSESAQGLASVKVDVIEESYVDKSGKDWFETSPWGEMYRHLYLMYAVDNTPNRVILH